MDVRKLLAFFVAMFLQSMLFSQSSTYPSGRIKTKGNRVNGEWIKYYENGNVEIKDNFVNGEYDGESIL